MAFLKIAMTPAGVPAAYTPRLADFEGLGQDETSWVDQLPGLIKAGGDVAANLYRAVNYAPAVYPTTYTSPGMTGGGAGLGGGTLLLVGGGLLLFLMMSGKRR